MRDRKIRFISGAPETVEEKLHELDGLYVMVSHNYAVIGDHLVITACCVLQSEMNKMAIMSPAMPTRRM